MITKYIHPGTVQVEQDYYNDVIINRVESIVE